MERQFCINWLATVEEARQRRKTQGLTQARLATIAGVSTPSVSRFERGEKDIQLSTIMRILTVLGMVDLRNFIFPEPNERFDSAQNRVIFTGREGDRPITCAITHDALNDYFEGVGHDPLKTFQINRQAIEHVARRKYLAGGHAPDGSILLSSADME